MQSIIFNQIEEFGTSLLCVIIQFVHFCDSIAKFTMPVGRMEGFDNVGTPRAGTEMCDDTDDDSIKNEYQVIIVLKMHS